MTTQESEIEITVPAGKGKTVFRLKPKTELAPMGQCDFCGAACNADMQGAKAAFECESVSNHITGVASLGAWAGCPACASLVDGQGWRDLEARMLSGQLQLHGLEEEKVSKELTKELKRLIIEQVRLFRRHRIVQA